MIGQTISHYKILEKLGEGGMGVVYKAQDVILERLVALKVLSERALVNEDDKARFVREAQLAASLSHPNIATVYEFGEFEARSFLAMEFLEGVTLAKPIKDGPLPLDELLKTATEVSEGLSKA
ncbi:MAG: protein kinase, partial [Bacteroidota bacterium]